MNKLLKIIEELKAPKDNFNKFGGYKYRSAENILEAVKPLCVKYDVVLNIEDEVVECGGKVYIRSTATLYDVEVVPGKEILHSSALAREGDTQAGMSAGQITGATSSYARKYALNGLFCIDDAKDLDSEEFQGRKFIPMSDSQMKRLESLGVEWPKCCAYLKVDSIDKISSDQAEGLIEIKEGNG